MMKEGLGLSAIVLLSVVAVGMHYGEKGVEVGNIKDAKVRALVEKAVSDGRLTTEELKTIYDAKAKILVAENAEAAKLLKTLHPDYDLIITGEMASKLDKELEKEFKDRYKPLLKRTDEEQRELGVKEKFVMDKARSAKGGDCYGPGNPYNPPYADENGRIFVISYSARDREHAPAGGVHWDDIVAGTEPFEREFGVDIIRGACYNCWDASGIDNNLSKLIDDFARDVSYGTYNTVIVGWVRYSDYYKGYAWIDNHYSVIAESRPPWFPHYPNDAVVQHEISHNFDAEDKQCTNLCQGECVMNYHYTRLGTEKWCGYHRVIVRMGVWGPNGDFYVE